MNRVAAMLDALPGDRESTGVFASYVLATTACSLAWGSFLVFVFQPIASKSATLTLVVSMIAAAVPGYVIHRHAPAKTVDRFHKFGVLLTMFVAANAVVTAGFFVAAYVDPNTGMSLRHGWTKTIEGVILYTVISSMLLPGPYAGILVARRWTS